MRVSIKVNEANIVVASNKCHTVYNPEKDEDYKSNRALKTKCIKDAAILGLNDKV